MAAPKAHIEILEPPLSPSSKGSAAAAELQEADPPAPAPPHPGVVGSPQAGGGSAVGRGGEGGDTRLPPALGARGEELAAAATPGAQRRGGLAQPEPVAEGESLDHRVRGSGLGKRIRAPRARAGRQVRGADYKSQHAQLP